MRNIFRILRNNMRSIGVLWQMGLAALILVLTVASTGSAFPITVTGRSGHTVHLEVVPKRVVSLVPGATETLFGLGAGDLIVGLTCYDTYPREVNAKPIVGGFVGFSPDLIKRLKPDVISFSARGVKK